MKIMPALREAISRFFNPPPGPEATVVRNQAERVKSAAAQLAEHHDVFAELVQKTNERAARGKPKTSKRARSK